MKTINKLLLITVLLPSSLTAIAQCSDTINASFTNVSAITMGCETTLGTFQNTSEISLSKVQFFAWNFGDGTSVTGTKDSTTLWNGTSHSYTVKGNFDVSLTIRSQSGCLDTFMLASAIQNIVMDPKISSDKKRYTTTELPITFSADGFDLKQLGNFLWNFGNPTSGNLNFNNNDLVVSRSFGLGAHMISLRVMAGPCDITVYDTIQVVGPLALIEEPYNRIGKYEKFQCGTADSVHFTNASQFYQNDGNNSDEDSVLTVSGKSLFAFNYTPPISGTGTGTGDQSALTSATHLANRKMGAQVKRIWDFGDAYAPQCTTSRAKGINVGINCN